MRHALKTGVRGRRRLGEGKEGQGHYSLRKGNGGGDDGRGGGGGGGRGGGGGGGGGGGLWHRWLKGDALLHFRSVQGKEVGLAG